ncbi:MAG: hypothetical protein DMF96_16890 [Acidobacteria bacterium]|nr:MAG: hypothetical protein DMF96_16890 [Acidobacteriota bacterium]
MIGSIGAVGSIGSAAHASIGAIGAGGSIGSAAHTSSGSTTGDSIGAGIASTTGSCLESTTSSGFARTRGADRNGPGRGGLVELRLQLCAFRSRFAQVGIDLLGEDRRFAAVGRRRFGAATPPLGEHASRLRKLRAVGQNRNRQRADIRGGGDHAQRRRQRRIVLRREERGHQYHVRHAVADRVERALGRFREDELGRDLLPDDSGQVGGLPPIRFDRENDGHPTFAA